MSYPQAAMPNWCSNELIVTGDAAAVSAFIRAVEDPETPLDFDKIIPKPESEEDWYTWCNKNWGTKWNADGVTRQAEDGRVAYNFQTAWAPPSKALMNKMAVMAGGAKVMLRYAERGIGFFGYWYYDGIKVNEACGKADDLTMQIPLDYVRLWKTSG